MFSLARSGATKLTERVCELPDPWLEEVASRSLSSSGTYAIGRLIGAMTRALQYLKNFSFPSALGHEVGESFSCYATFNFAESQPSNASKRGLGRRAFQARRSRGLLKLFEIVLALLCRPSAFAPRRVAFLWSYAMASMEAHLSKSRIRERSDQTRPAQALCDQVLPSSFSSQRAPV